MIVTFATQKGGVGKTTLAIAFANYLTLVKKEQVHVFDFDFQKSFYQKWIDDNEDQEESKIYNVEIINFDTDNQNQLDFQQLIDMKSSNTFYLFDLAGTLDERYMDILIYSDFIVIPFEYSDVSTKSTLVFINLLGLIESESERVFIRSRYDKNYNYKNQEGMDEEIQKYGTLLKSPVYKRNELQSINTRKLTYKQKNAVEKTFNELISFINEVKEITV